LNDLLKNLTDKSNSVIRNTGDSNNKYNSAFDYINKTLESTPNIDDKDLNLVVQAGLQRNGIDFTSDGSVRGGYVKASRKHKKYGKNGKKSTTRKQKGGFAWGKYKKTSTSAAPTTPTTKSTSSLTHSRKKYKMNRARGLTKRRK